MDKKNTTLLKKIHNALIGTIQRAVTQPRPDIAHTLQKSLDSEQSEIAKSQLELMLENFDYGKAQSIPICQDTGVLNFFIELGDEFPIFSNFKTIIKKSVKEATKIIPLRNNVFDPLTNESPDSNVGINVPPIYLKIVENKDTLKITCLPKGGGAENISKLFMLTPADGLQTFQKEIINTIQKAGGMPCPPVVLGIGLGGDATLCMKLAKEALLRPLHQRHPRKDVAELELKLLKNINQLNVGPMGLGGNLTCIDVHIEIAMRHPASYPVGLIVQCYSHRWASFEINKKGEIIDES
ncbi:MAG: fumarate hydratase [Promethearchaeota archaeon]|nr:MAG: fumarate hydratase [Candidatus Lokiarchaeota archaeon]